MPNSLMSADDQIQVLPPGLCRLVESVLVIAREGKTTKYAVSRKLDLGTRYFEPYFRFLTKAGIIVSKTGPTGGVWLAKPTDDITVGDLARALEETAANVRPKDGLRYSVIADQHSDHPAIRQMRSRMIAEMDAVTIADLLAERPKIAIVA